MKRIGAAISGTIIVAAGLIGLYFGIITLDELSSSSGPYAFVGLFILAFVLPIVICGISAIKPYVGVIRNKKNPAMSLVLVRGFAIVVGILLLGIGYGGLAGPRWLMTCAALVYFHFNWAIKDFHSATDQTHEFRADNSNKENDLP